MVENAQVLPGEVIVGTDSYTCTYGALGAFSTGIGSTEMLGVLVSGEIWLKVPESVKVVFAGKPAERVMAKGIALKVIGTLGHGGATYKALEFAGETFENMIMDERLCIANMAVEAGAKNGIFPFDGIAKRFLKEQANVPVHQAYIGSCTGGRYYDLKVAADFLKGKKVAKGIRLLVSPVSSEVWKWCARDGIFYRNCINLGVLAVECSETEKISYFDEVEIDCVQGVVTNKTKNETYRCHVIPEHITRLVETGGLYEYLKVRKGEKNEEDQDF